MSFNVRRTAGTPISDEQRRELRALSAMPDDQIDFSDIPERFYDEDASKSLPLEDHTLTLRVDAEVAAWLEATARRDAGAINLVLKRAARRTLQIRNASHSSLHKAS